MQKKTTLFHSGRVSASFRDPNGFLFTEGGGLFRQVNRAYAANYDRLMESGLYTKLVESGLLIPHQELKQARGLEEGAYKVLQPEVVPFISYPYEWSFSQYKDAALVTLDIQKRALKAGMILKDASAYNIQFFQGRPVLIDTLSFEVNNEGQPWVAYRQFCQHFLAPIALMAYKDVRLSQLMRIHLDGVPLDLARKLLPFVSWLNLGVLTHIHIHSIVQERFGAADIKRTNTQKGMSGRAMLGLIESLEATVKKLHWSVDKTAWGDYYSDTNYSQTAFTQKKHLISIWLERVKPRSVIDLGANIGEFSRLASQSGIETISADFDPGAVEKNYQQVKRMKENHLLPLWVDLTNPSPSIGWANRERGSLGQRGRWEMVFALALVHHLAITNNVPLVRLAEFFSELGHWLVIEFVPKSDSQVHRLLSSREDIFDHYSKSGFEEAFGCYFKIHDVVQIDGSDRILYLLESKID